MTQFSVASLTRVHELAELQGREQDQLLARLPWDLLIRPDLRTERDLIEFFGQSKPLHGVVAGLQPFTRAAIEALVANAGRGGLPAPAIARDGVGYDKVDLAAARQFGVRVSITEGVNTVPVAEQTFGLMFAGMRGITQSHQSMQQGIWTPRLGVELCGSTVGILGFGHVGPAMAQRLKAFGVRIVVYDPKFLDSGEGEWRSGKRGLIEALDIEIADSPEVVFGAADVILLHASPTPSSRNLLNERTFARCKPGVIVVNTARGDLVNVEHLRVALDSRQVGMYLVDVFEPEPLAADHWLRTHPQVVCTPHNASLTYKTRPLQSVRAFENLQASMSGVGTVNAYVA